MLAPACLLLLVVPALPVAAQPPPPMESPGWVANKRSGTGGSNHPADFDWTGQTLTTITTPFWGAPYSTQYTSYGGVVGPSLGMFGMNMTRELFYSVTGTSTFVWEWRPPQDLNHQAGPPYDLHSLFAQQPIWALGRVSPHIAAGTSDPFGLSATGQVWDGWGWTIDLPGIPGEAPPANSPDSVRRAVVAAQVAGRQVTFSLSSGASIDGVAQPGFSSGTLSLTEGLEPFPILLQRPDPVGRPDKLDGYNQYVYSDAAEGVLNVLARISVPRALQADTQWLLTPTQHVELAIEPTIPGLAAGHTYLAQDGSIVPQNVSLQSQGVYTFYGLPETNGSFGPHTMTLKVDGQTSQTARFETFFNGLATNHPGPDRTPNWYYYYRQLYDPGQGHVVYEPDGPNTPGVTQVTEDLTIHLSNEAYRNWADGQRTRTIQVFSVSNGHVKWAGQLQVWGILRFVYAYAHEQAHVEHLQAGLQLLYPDTERDGDGDRVRDGFEWQFEQRNGLYPTERDSTGAYPGDAQGDSQCLADIDALGAVLPNQGLWTQDWTQGPGGLRWGLLGPFDRSTCALYGRAEPGPALHPWQFRSRNPETGLFGAWTDQVPAGILTSISQLPGGGQ